MKIKFLPKVEHSPLFARRKAYGHELVVEIAFKAWSYAGKKSRYTQTRFADFNQPPGHTLFFAELANALAVASPGRNQMIVSMVMNG